MVIRVLHQSPAPTLTFHLLLSPPVTLRLHAKMEQAEGGRRGEEENQRRSMMKDWTIGEKSGEEGRKKTRKKEEKRESKRGSPGREGLMDGDGAWCWGVAD